MHNKEKRLVMSPHLGIYKWQINSIFSILHRISGVAIYFFLLIFVWLLSFNIFYPDCECVIFVSNFGKFIITCSSFLCYYHLFNGIRHVFWDITCKFDIKTMQLSSILILVCTIVLTVMTTIALYL